MAKNDTPIWTLVGILIGIITSNLVSPDYKIFGAVFGGLIGYFLSRIIE